MDEFNAIEVFYCDIMEIFVLNQCHSPDHSAVKSQSETRSGTKQ